jgi:hypothetical protein
MFRKFMGLQIVHFAIAKHILVEVNGRSRAWQGPV